ncbi:flavoprotein [Tsuneonella sp. SYSU-LHT278]|uniref:flavoprotein n=1 Tax=Tsuneonella sediminis TaxID=3416089 RepID=UPI003F7A1C27
MRWLLGVCGAGAATAIPQQVLILTDQGVEVTVVLSRNAHRFVNVEVLSAFARGKVFSDMFQSSNGIFIPHIELAESADALVIMPASAAQISRLATGAADDLISAIAVHCDIPVFVVPALNEAAFSKQIVQRNLRLLEEAGMSLIFAKEAHALRAANGARVPCGFPSVLSVLEHVANSLSVVGDADGLAAS